MIFNHGDLLVRVLQVQSLIILLLQPRFYSMPLYLRPEIHLIRCMLNCFETATSRRNNPMLNQLSQPVGSNVMKYPAKCPTFI